jgi:hypothetical protein
MIAARRIALVAIAWGGVAASSARAQDVQVVDEGGLRYEIRKQVVQRQVPVTEMRNQPQTVLRQQVTTDTLQQQQLYTVPVTQYQLVSTLHGRWNPFVTPYWTHQYQPVTTWTQQAATVSIPISRVAWVPETRTVQLPTTTYRTASEEFVTRRCLGPSPTISGSQQMMASAPPSATLTPRAEAATASVPSVASATSGAGYGGAIMPSDPPKHATGWQTPSDTRYGDPLRR